MNAEDMRVYKQAMDVGERVWDIVIKWGFFEKDTIGKQLVRAIDSVAANLSEGFGRYHYREKKNFSYYSRGSLYESKTWLTKAQNRGLIEEADYEIFNKEVNSIGMMLNKYIRSLGSFEQKNSNQVHEPEASYQLPETDFFEQNI